MPEHDYRPAAVSHLLTADDLEAAWRLHPGENRKLYGRAYNGVDLPETLRPLLDYIGLGEPTYMVLNRDDPTELHRDHDLGSSEVAAPGRHVSALAIFIDGDVEGHELVFPESGRSYTLGHGDLLIFASSELHGNTPRTGGTGQRTAVLAYYHLA